MHLGDDTVSAPDAYKAAISELLCVTTAAHLAARFQQHAASKGVNLGTLLYSPFELNSHSISEPFSLTSVFVATVYDDVPKPSASDVEDGDGSQAIVKQSFIVEPRRSTTEVTKFLGTLGSPGPRTQ